MISRLHVSVFSAALALAAFAPLHAAPAASAEAAAVSTVTYRIKRHNQQVVVEDAAGKALTTFSAVTPILRGLWVWSAPAAATNAPRSLSLTLSDQNGRRLWSTPVPVVYPQNVSVNYNTTAGGTLLTISTTQDNASNPDYPPASGINFTIGPDGRPVSFGDASHQYKYVYEPQGFSVVGPDGKVLMHADADAKANKFEVSSPAGESLHFNSDGTGTMQINGTNIAIDKVTKDGKLYQSFPWNGHKVLVEQSCTITVTSDGDLRVNAPSPTKTAAKK